MAFVQGASNGSSTTVTTFTVTLGAVGDGNTVWGVVTWDSTTGNSISSVKIGGVSATLLDSVTDGGNTIITQTFILGNISGTPTDVVVLFTGTGSDSCGCVAIEESGCAALANPTDVHVGALSSLAGTGANILTSGNVTTTVANAIIVGACQSNGTT